MNILFTIGKRSIHLHWLVLAFVSLFIGVFMARNTGNSALAAYSNNPRGFADYCALVNGQTVIYGWAYDPQAPAGAQPYIKLNVTGVTTPATTPSDIVYRQATLNSDLSQSYPGAPQPGTYGWKVVLGSLYQGTAYKLSGTIFNYGAGANSILNINDSHHVDNDTSKPYFPSFTIPNTCLQPKPVVVTPPPPVVVTPKPPAVVKPTPIPTAPVPSNAADGSVTVGTASAIINVPVGKATSIHLLYGKDATLEATPDQPTNGTDSTISLTGLSAKTTYSYKIVRTLGTQTTTSEVATFTTNGYALVLSFTNNSKKPVEGIAVVLNDTKVLSDSSGNVRFEDLAAGTYNPKFTYHNKDYFQDITVGPGSNTEDGKTITVSKTINLDQLQNTSSLTQQTTSGSKVKTGLLITVGIAVLLGLAVIGWFIWKLLATRMQDRHVNKPRAGRDIIDAHSTLQFNQANQPAGPQPHNVGVSLKDMVIQSMREQAANQPQQSDPNDPNNWQPPAPGR